MRRLIFGRGRMSRRVRIHDFNKRLARRSERGLMQRLSFAISSHRSTIISTRQLQNFNIRRVRRHTSSSVPPPKSPSSKRIIRPQKSPRAINFSIAQITTTTWMNGQNKNSKNGLNRRKIRYSSPPAPGNWLRTMHLIILNLSRMSRL